jgi:hypothetical protein
MVGIGMNFASPAATEPNIEDTLLFASIEAMERDDLRVLAVLVTWFGVHHPWVNADQAHRHLWLLCALIQRGKMPGLGVRMLLGSKRRLALTSPPQCWPKCSRQSCWVIGTALMV